MSLLDVFKTDYVAGRVVDKYRLNNGNIGVVVDQRGTGKRYHVLFKDDYKAPGPYNLYGLLNEPFSGKTKSVDKLINKGDNVELKTNYSKSPFRQAYKIYSASPVYKTPKNPVKLPYKPAKMHRY